MPHAKVDNISQLRHWVKASKARRLKEAKKKKKK